MVLSESKLVKRNKSNLVFKIKCDIINSVIKQWALIERNIDVNEGTNSALDVFPV